MKIISSKGFTQHHLCLKSNRRGLSNTIFRIKSGGALPSTTFRNKSGAGFTLVEILVAGLISMLIIGVASGLYVSFVRYQRRVLAKQELLNQTGYVVEYMSRALRIAKKDTSGSCLGTDYKRYNYKSIDDGKGIKFINHSENDVCQEFFWNEDEERLEESKNGGQRVPLTSDKLQINFLKFNISGEHGDDLLQPRVTIFLEVQVRGTGDQPKVQIQATISQRNLDV